MVFERFTEKGIKSIMLAQQEARRLGHNFVGTEQILLGLIGEGTGSAAKVLEAMYVNLEDAREEVEKIIGRGSGFVAVEIPFTPRAKRVIELALEDSQKLATDYIGTEHLLLGLIREGEGVAVRVLENLCVDFNKLKEQLIKSVEHKSDQAVDLTARGLNVDKFTADKPILDKPVVSGITKISGGNRAVALSKIIGALNVSLVKLLSPESRELVDQLGGVLRNKEVALHSQDFELTSSLFHE